MKQCIPALVVAGLLLSACVNQETREDVRREIDSQDLVIRELQKKNEDLIARAGVLETKKRTLEAQNEALLSKVASADAVRGVARQLSKLEQELSNLDSGLVTKAHSEGLAIEVHETLLFAPGKATLREAGRKLLTQLAAKLGPTGGNLRVEGHTDSQPIRVTRGQYPMGNLQLSGIRALEVAHFLVSAGGLSPTRVSYAGYGKHRPVAANDTPLNMAKNRRVEIVLLAAGVSKGR
ncbi:MAG: hypothetical protein CMJ90_15705 [Planctomycetes bacterium]|nr:hypothetical protein [Planctomycetota bacterium]